MPAKIDKCVASLMKKEDFKPKKGKTKKESAWAICTKMHQDGKLTEANDEEMKVVFATWDDYLKFDEEIATVGEELNRDKAWEEMFDHIRALENSVGKILNDEEVKDKKKAIMSQIDEFQKLFKAKIKELGDFEEQGGQVITFTGEVGDHQVVDNEDGTVTIKHLPIFELGTHRGYPYDEDWATNKALVPFNAEKEKGYMPPLIIDHTDDKGTSKPVKGFMDNLRLEGDIFFIDALNVPKEDARGYPYRSVEINPNSHQITALALLSTNRPHFKFPPVMFGEKEEGKHDGIILTFFDENLKERGGEISMKTEKDLKLTEEEKGLVGKFVELIGSLRKKKDPEKPAVEVFSEADVKEREDKAVKKANEAAKIEFAESKKKEELIGFFADLFGGNGKKEGNILAPHLKPRVEAFIEALNNQPTIKFTEEVGEGDQKVKKEFIVSPFGMAKDLFTEILGKNGIVVLTEESRLFTKTPNPEESDDGKFGELGSRVAKKHSAKNKDNK